MILYIPLIALLFEHTEKTYEHIKRIAVISGIILFIIGNDSLKFSDIAKRDENTSRRGYIQYLLDNQLDFGFATFWNANVTTELTNGKIELVGMTPDNQFRFFSWLTLKKYSNPSYHEGETFLLLSRTEWQEAIAAGRLFAQFQPDYEDNRFVIIKSPSTYLIHSEILGN